MTEQVKQVGEQEVTLLPEGNIATPQGFTAGGVHCGIRKTKLDFGWVYSDVPATTAGVYTTNIFQAAPLKVTQESISSGQKIQALLVNSGIANACTGEQGLADAYQMRKWGAEAFRVPEQFTAIASTGLIGEPLPMEKIKYGIDQIQMQGNHHSNRFEQAILTTDTREKAIAVEIEIDGQKISIGGAAKGSGMIHPNMATMLSFITTDAAVEAEALSLALKDITNTSFNMITVDGDTSTNDMVLVLANGKAGNELLHEGHPDWSLFKQGLAIVCEALAKEIARDGEGATKLVEVQVEGAESDQAARAVSKAIISSNLIKTAIHGADANWGRIITAIGYSDQPVDPDKVSISLGPVLVVNKGMPVPFDEAAAKDHLLQDNVSIHTDLGSGTGKATAWGCDLSYDYVRINASYRT
ncbi:bifunctional glutamate N-acetyltransferase/amino-acid acetyltransferase ArgJ [Sediminibacillus halophilus]|uniref:Arginine biosynthesis bifunctional protein ArgJ n=1 Tax=Sediminibacillus halophilus TaxID=482461 RepID=A0A1G9TH82_9BACI|nr:bifunctional glutamate N-acetyltransferase/amino-acid acetyltransferase ArgJ [Sediminibacillus halophilus]SDM47067.1 glutamate N-acetyltransferase / amino-acid N-acetyltransferase [Sediminibacillus halophilus]